MGSRDDIARSLRRILRLVVDFYGSDIGRETYWHGLEEGDRSPRMSGSFRSNPRDYAWEARNCPAIRDALADLVPQLDAVHGNRLIRRIGAGTQRLGCQQWATQEILNASIAAAVSGKTNPGQIRRLANRLRLQLTGDSYTWRLTVPMEGLALPPGRDSYRVSAEARLRAMPLVEREMLINADMLSLSSAAVGRIVRSQIALEYSVVLSASDDLGHTKFSEIVESSRDFATLFSAVSNSDVRIAGFFAAPDLLAPLGIPFSQVPEMPIYEPLNEPFVFSAAAAARLTRLTESATSGPNSGLVRVAVTRLFEVMNHQDPGGRLIDAWIALESLYLSDTNAELKFRAAIRIAGFSDSPDRERVYDFVRRSYDTRSKLVHGGAVDPNALRELADGTVSLARLSLLRVLQQSIRFQPADIELALLRSSVRSGS